MKCREEVPAPWEINTPIAKDKGFTTFEQQIKILKGRNLKFVSEETALIALRREGYYSIINGYKDPYVEIVDEKEMYREGVTFEQIYSLYSMDRQIRGRLMDAMLEFESNLRTAVAHTIGAVSVRPYPCKNSIPISSNHFPIFLSIPRI